MADSRMKRILITTDLGHLKAYRVMQGPDDPSPTIEAIVEEDFSASYTHISARVTDAGGRFPAGKNGMAVGERNHEAEQALRKQLKCVASANEEAPKLEPEATLQLAAPKPIFKRLSAELRPDLQKRLGTCLELDLVKASKQELLRRFGTRKP